jgi:chemotaxis protein CheD
MSGLALPPDATLPTITVRVADAATAQGAHRLVTLGLGSCVAIVLYHAAARAGGLAHVLLPDASMARDASNPHKFAATSVPVLVEAMRGYGPPSALTARLVGGAKMFAQLLPQGGINMGERNVLAARAALVKAGVPLVGEDTGGEHGRSVYFDVTTGRVSIRSVKAGVREL